MKAKEGVFMAKSVVELAKSGATVNGISEMSGLTRTQIASELIKYIVGAPSAMSVSEDALNDINERGLTVKFSGRKKTLEELIKALNIDEKEWTVTNVTYNEWDGMRPNDMGTILMHQVKVSLKRNTLQVNYEVPKPINITVKSSNKAKTVKKNSDIKVAVILPDMQVGFKRNMDTGELISLHDRAAMDVALQIVRYVKPDRIVLLGDNLDLPQESKYLTSPEFYFTTQAAAVELAWWLSQLREINPDMEIDYIEGNHDARASKTLMQNAVSAYGLKAADDINGPPLMSIEKLLGLKNLDIKYHGGYPMGKVVINDNLVCIHGEVARSESGATVASVVKDTRVSVIQGHIHRYEVATKTLWSADNTAHMYTAASFGCLCKIDPGAVPGCKAHQNWQQGLGIVYYEDRGLQQFRQEFVPIINGRAILQSEIFEADDEDLIVQAIENDTGYKVS